MLKKCLILGTLLIMLSPVANAYPPNGGYGNRYYNASYNNWNDRNWNEGRRWKHPAPCHVPRGNAYGWHRNQQAYYRNNGLLGLGILGL